MAAAAPSPLVSSAEKTNGVKLSRLLIDGGTTVLRNAFDNYHPPANLAADLNVQYKTLLSLLRRRILNKSQWEKLFPPSGAKPDSKSFDITLLFLLLTTICGLSPPLSGWHIKPPPSDTSFEANLARIKFFRNELYGHVSSTGVDTPTFKALWHEIRAVVIALGLDQAEIDRLQAQSCGEDDYIDVLTEWADSEQEIKSEVNEMRRDVKKVLQTQLEDRKIKHESESRLEQVQEIVNKTHQAINEARHAQLEDNSSLHDTILRLDEIHQIENETNDATKELRQTQLKDHKTLQDGVSKLEGISQTQTKTQQAVEEVHETLEAGLQEVKQKVEALNKKREMDRADELLRNLAKSEFKGDIEYHAQRFQEGTRKWIFKRVDDWLDDRTSPNRLMVISANAGIGKSVISAIMCKRMQEAGRLSGSHFCQYNNVRYRKPQLMIQSLACHLSHTLPGYKKSLVEQLSRNLGPVELNSMGVEELFALLFKEPLNIVEDPGRNILMVIDGLDESEYQGRNELLDVIANQFSRLPQWIRFFVTTRPEINIADSLKYLQPIHLDENQEENLRDIRLFFEMRLSPKIPEEQKDLLLTKLVDKSEGVFLYAYFLIDHIQENIPILTLEQLKSSLPLGISSVYLCHFKRLENELRKELKMDEDQVLSFLCAFTASREPMPIAFVSRLLSPGGKSLSAQRRINKAVASISSLLPLRNDCLHFFHKSIKDWLTNTSCYGRHNFTVDEKEGHEILFELCKNELDNIKRKGVRNLPFSDTESYALQHGVQHMIELNKSSRIPRPCAIEELVSTYVTDLELIYSKLCVNSTAASEDIFSIQKHIKPTLLSERSQSLLTSLLKVLRKHSYLLRYHPQLWFQSLINEGPPDLSSEAANILENRLPNVPYMKYLDKENQNGVVQARFYGSETVACFDVSPEMDYMVCECRDGTMHMWSLKTGNKEWVRPSLIKRLYHGVHPDYSLSSDGGAYRWIDKILTFYRSVVFHPNGKCVLPGNLRSVYTLDGDCNDLFRQSNCVFSHCAFPREKGIILTDCCDDPKKVVLWSMENGQELKIIPCENEITSFAISQDGTLVAFADSPGYIYLVDVDKWRGECLFKSDYAACGLLHFTTGNEALVCGYLPYGVEDLGCHRYGWASENEPTFLLTEFKEFLSSSSCDSPDPFFLRIKFFFWPIEPRTLANKLFSDDGLRSTWLDNVRLLFPSLPAGFYKKLSRETALVGSPSLKYVVAVDLDLLKEVNSASTLQVVEKVELSSVGDTIYCVSLEEYEEDTGKEIRLVTVYRMSTGEVLVKKCFTCASLCLVPMKEGVILYLKDQVPELWNFELTECVRPIARLTGTENLIYLSDEVIACVRQCRTLTRDELLDFSPFHSSAAEESPDLLPEDESVKHSSVAEESSDLLPEDESMKHSSVAEESSDLLPEDESVEQDLDESVDEGDSTFLHNSSSLDISLDSSVVNRFFNVLKMLIIWDSLNVYQLFVVDIVSVTNEECVSSIKTRVYRDEDVLFISCNSQNQLLVCTIKEIVERSMSVEHFTVSLRNNNLLRHVWERSEKRLEGPLRPCFMFSPDEQFVISWDSFDSGYGVHIIDAKTGKTRHSLLTDQDNIVDCKFVVNDESLVCCSKDNFLRLFNIRSGDLLSVLDIEERPQCLQACLDMPLVAIGFLGARLKFVHVELPSVQDAEGKKGFLTKQK